MATWVPTKLMSLNRFYQFYFPICSKSTPQSKIAPAARALKLKNNNTNRSLRLLIRHCSPVDSGIVDEEEEDEEGFGIMCEPCNGRGWLVCDFCNGQKTNVKTETSRIYRRCPTCKAVGYILCEKCKVFKCVTYPDFSDDRL